MKYYVWFVRICSLVGRNFYNVEIVKKLNLYFKDNSICPF